MTMSVPDFPDVTLASADPDILQCWEEKVRQGAECLLLLKHSRGKVTTILKCSKTRRPEAKAHSTVPAQAEKWMKKKNREGKKTLVPAPPPHIEAKKKKVRKGCKKKKLDALLLYHQRLVEEKGLPPSRLMLMQAASTSSPSAAAEGSEQEDNRLFKCNQCEFTTSSLDDMSLHVGNIHKEQQMPADHVEESHNVHVSEDKESDIDTQTSNIKCPSCRTSFETEHSLAIHMGYPIAGGTGFGDSSNVKCQLCDHCERLCSSMVEHVQEKHRKTHSIISKLKVHYAGCLRPDTVYCNDYCNTKHCT